MAYLILILLFALPLAIFLKSNGSFTDFTYAKFVTALNRACIVYLVLSIGFAFLFAWLDSAYIIKEDGSWLNIAAEVSLSFITVSLTAVLLLFIVLNIIKWCLPKKKEKNITM
jgi:hypothetical protein